MDILKDKLEKYADSDMYPFHMPGHKRAGGEEFKRDITEIDGFDNLHDPKDVIREEMDFAKRLYHTEETYFLVNGSTCGVLAAISAAVPRGGRILIERGCHISVYHAAYLRDLAIDYIDYGTRGRFLPDAIVITSPSYEGCVKDVRKMADYAHSLGIPLIVDEAHGAHFSLHPYFPDSAVTEGADLVIQSTHKTLPTLTQTALLHNVSGMVPDETIRKFLDIYETSSPSYLLLSSVTDALHSIYERGTRFFDPYVRALKVLRRSLSELTHLKLLGGVSGVISDGNEFPPYLPGTLVDPGKIVIMTDESDIDGPGLYRELLEKYHLQPEMAAPEYVLLMTSVNDTKEGFDRLTAAMTEIDARLKEADAAKQERLWVQNHIGNDGAERIFTIAEAADAPASYVPLDEAVALPAADYVIVYPPDSPILVPGEIVRRDTVRLIRSRMRAGLTVSGVRDGCIKVVGK